MVEGLKPCPFCGGEVFMHYTGSSDWEVECKNCPVGVSFWVSAKQYGYGEGERNEAVARWNRRTAPEVARTATFEEWWAMRTQYGTENKDLARDAWFGAAAAYNRNPSETAIAHAHNIVGLPILVGLKQIPVGAMIVAEELLRLAGDCAPQEQR